MSLDAEFSPFYEVLSFLLCFFLIFQLKIMFRAYIILSNNESFKKFKNRFIFFIFIYLLNHKLLLTSHTLCITKDSCHSYPFLSTLSTHEQVDQDAYKVDPCFIYIFVIKIPFITVILIKTDPLLNESMLIKEYVQQREVYYHIFLVSFIDLEYFYFSFK